MSVMVQIFHEVKDIFVLFNEAKPSWMEYIIFYLMKYDTNEKTFIICFI